MPLRIMFMANAPWCTTGYGVQGKHLVQDGFKRLGHIPAYFAYYGLQNGRLNLGGVPIYSMAYQPWGHDILDAHMRHFKADILITLMDIWVTDFIGKHAKEGGWSWLPWTPIDQEPVPQLVIDRSEGAHTIIAYSRFGERKLKELGMTNIAYIPHGVNTKVFKPMDKAEARTKQKLPLDAYIIGVVAANKGYPSRKCFPEQFLAFKKFKDVHPEALMYLHTLRGSETLGIDFSILMKSTGLVEGRDVVFTDQYSYVTGLPEEAMPYLYNSFDCLSLTSMGEGFGIPLIEAQACGIPVITSNNTSMPELCFAGELVTKQYPFFTPLGGFSQIPEVNAIYEAYERMYEKQHNPVTAQVLSEQAREGAMAYDWDLLIDTYWKPFLENLEPGIRASQHRHTWGAVGLYNKDGSLSIPCIDPKCTTELRVQGGVPDQKEIIVNGMPMVVGDIPLDIADHPIAPVSKVTAIEAIRDYHMDELGLFPGDLVIVANANVGVSAIYLAKKYPGIQVLAFEPVGENFDRLMRNIQVNGVENVFAFHRAIAGTPGRVRVGGDLNLGADVSSTMALSSEPGEIVEATTICDLFRERGIRSLALLVLDVEGSEYEILTGDTPLQKVERLIGEIHEGPSLEAKGFRADSLISLIGVNVPPERTFLTKARID